MKVAIFAVSKKGQELADKIQKCDTLARSRCVTFFDGEGLKDNVRREFYESDALIFVCASGIAVRLIAPFIEHKSVDPAVLVFDEGMNYCIPILSGHLGGANELARSISADIGTAPVITTASDLAGLTAPDLFAKSLGLVITDLAKAKDLTAALLNGEKIGVLNKAGDVIKLGEEDLPKGYTFLTEDNIENFEDIKNILSISYRDDSEDKDTVGSVNTLTLVPRCLKIGLGCRRGTQEETIRAAVDECLKLHGLYKEAVKGVFTIDLKQDEEGLLDYCNNEGIPVTFYSADRLREVPGDFRGSDFVKEVTGVDNVCERSALASGGWLIVNREVHEGVTVAVAAGPLKE